MSHNCFAKINIGDIITACFESYVDLNGHTMYVPSHFYTFHKFDFPVISINKYGDPEIGLFDHQNNIYGFWSDPQDNDKIKYILYLEDIKIVKIKKVK